MIKLRKRAQFTVGIVSLLLCGLVQAATTIPTVEPTAHGFISKSDAAEDAAPLTELSTSPAATTGSDSLAFAGTASHAFGTVDLKTGVFSELGNTGILLAGMGVANGKLYAAGYASETLYTVNISNGKLSAVGNASIEYTLLGSTTDGVLYATDGNSNLYSINSSTGASKLIGPIGISYSGYYGLSNNSSILYFANDTNLYTLNTHTGAATLVGSMGSIKLGGLVFEDNVLWGGQEPPSLAVATVSTSTGKATTGAAFTGTGSGTWWAIAPSPIPPVSSSTSLKASATSVTYGTSVSFTVLVTSVPGTSTPAGSVEFLDGSNKLATVTLNGAGQATYSTSALGVGTHSITAKYLGTSGDKASTSSAVSLTVKGVPATMLSATSLAFGSEPTNKTSTAKAFTVTNDGTATLTFSSIKLTGSQADDFAMTTTCGTTLAANASCTISVTFAPVSTGAKAASVSIADNASGSPFTVKLSGTGVAAASSPAATLSTTSLAFGNEKVKSTSAGKSVTVTNSGSSTLSITGITLAGGQADDFTLSKTCGSTLAAGKSCTVTTSFTPVSAGAKSASISIADNASGSPQSVTLTGTGVTGS